METLSASLGKVVSAGYTTDFKVTGSSLLSLGTGQRYSASQVDVVDFFRYEGISDPEDNSILYVIETPDGVKGTLMNAYGLYSDDEVGSFMLSVRRIKKK
jgi:hypothetical protein